MSYTRLPFNQYYIDESNGYRNKNKRRFNIEFNHTEFEYKFLWKKVKCSADWEIHYEADRNVIQINFEETNEIKNENKIEEKKIDIFSQSEIQINNDEDY